MPNVYSRVQFVTLVKEIKGATLSNNGRHLIATVEAKEIGRFSIIGEYGFIDESYLPDVATSKILT